MFTFNQVQQVLSEFAPDTSRSLVKLVRVPGGLLDEFEVSTTFQF